MGFAAGSLTPLPSAPFVDLLPPLCGSFTIPQIKFICDPRSLLQFHHVFPLSISPNNFLLRLLFWDSSLII
jgi:hypothetical protein